MNDDTFGLRGEYDLFYTVKLLKKIIGRLDKIEAKLGCGSCEKPDAYDKDWQEVREWWKLIGIIKK